jgi:hypothetical protein
MTDTLWSVEMIATATGTAPATIRAYNSRGQMPPPTGHIGRSPYWAAHVIGPWIDSRGPGNDPAQRDVVKDATSTPPKKGKK